jgi:hypothetical protein
MLLTNFADVKRSWIVRGDSAEVAFSSMLEFSAEKSSRLPDEPIENPLEEQTGQFKNQIFVVGNTAFEIFGRNDTQGEKYAEIILKKN